jgi:hypothetical protein
VSGLVEASPAFAVVNRASVPVVAIAGAAALRCRDAAHAGLTHLVVAAFGDMGTPILTARIQGAVDIVVTIGARAALGADAALCAADQRVGAFAAGVDAVAFVGADILGAGIAVIALNVGATLLTAQARAADRLGSAESVGTRPRFAAFRRARVAVGAVSVLTAAPALDTSNSPQAVLLRGTLIVEGLIDASSGKTDVGRALNAIVAVGVIATVPAAAAAAHLLIITLGRVAAAPFYGTFVHGAAVFVAAVFGTQALRGATPGTGQ